MSFLKYFLWLGETCRTGRNVTYQSEHSFNSHSVCLQHGTCKNFPQETKTSETRIAIEGPITVHSFGRNTMQSPTSIESSEEFRDEIQIVAEPEPTRSQETPTTQDTRNSEIPPTPSSSSAPTETNASPFPNNTQCNALGVSSDDSNHQTEDYQAEGSPPDVHTAPASASPCGDTSASGEAPVPEGAGQVTVVMDSPLTPPPPEYDALPVIITEQPRVIMMVGNGIPCNVALPPGDPPPTYEEVLGLPVPVNQSAMEGVLADQEENKEKGSRVVGCIVFLALIIPFVIVIIVTNIVM